ncbi:hypothetical protein BA895_08405 [Humibacillus sp. DSM 29435]|nr:hypothetical protein BA895_08405 [Humibacillus sp. DSM 29435]
MWSGLRDAFAVVSDGLRLVARHLPTLLTLFLLGAAVRGAVIWLAVNVSDEHPVLAQLLLPLAPIGTLAAIIFMLRALSPSLRHASFDPVDTEAAPAGTGTGTAAVDVAASPASELEAPKRLTRAAGRRLGLLASLLVPFLTVYSAQGFLEADRRQFINMAAFNEFRESADFFYGSTSGPNRFLIGTGLALVGVIVVAFALRRLINHFELAEKYTGVGLVAAYIEIFWIFALANGADQLLRLFADWRDSRAFSVWVLERWNGLVEVLGPIGVPLRAVVEWVTGLLANGTDLVVVPIAWLTVGAVAYGRSANLGPTAGVDAGGWRRRVPALGAVATRLPGPLRRVGRSATADVRERFATFAGGVRLLVVAGLVPMLLFCIVFTVARGVQWAVAELLRQLRGPVEVLPGSAFLPWFDLIETGFYTVLLVGLIAAAVDRIIVRRTQTEAVSVSVG